MQIIVLSIDIASITFYLNSSFFIILCLITAKAVKELALSGQPGLVSRGVGNFSLVHFVHSSSSVCMMMLISCDWNQGYGRIEVKVHLLNCQEVTEVE
jgi:hypothetical protein